MIAITRTGIMMIRQRCYGIGIALMENVSKLKATISQQKLRNISGKETKDMNIMNKQKFELGLDHKMLAGAKAAFDTCLRAAVAKAIGTGSDEGAATLKLSFEIMTALDKDTGEYRRIPVMKYKTSYSVPMKASMDATIDEPSKLIPDEDIGYMLINDQISIEEIM